LCDAAPCTAFGELLMTFDKKLTLKKLERGNGSTGYTEKASRTVWANVEDIGVTVKYSAASAGREAQLRAICHRKEAEGYTHAVYEGVTYRIDSTGAADNKRHIKLILAKGG